MKAAEIRPDLQRQKKTGLSGVNHSKLTYRSHLHRSHRHNHLLHHTANCQLYTGHYYTWTRLQSIVSLGSHVHQSHHHSHYHHHSANQAVHIDQKCTWSPDRDRFDYLGWKRYTNPINSASDRYYTRKAITEDVYNSFCGCRDFYRPWTSLLQM